jgi:yecA family protein
LLPAFLAQPSRPSGTLTYHELQDFLFAVTAAPQPIRPLEWVPVVFARQPPGYASPEEAQAILAALTQAYSDIGRGVRAGSPLLPSDLEVLPDALANFDDAPLGQWARGFRIGHEWLRELWATVRSDAASLELGATLTTLLFFSSRALAESLHAATGARRPFDALAETMRDAIPAALVRYARLGRSAYVAG